MNACFGNLPIEKMAERLGMFYEGFAIEVDRKAFEKKRAEMEDGETAEHDEDADPDCMDQG